MLGRGEGAAVSGLLELHISGTVPKVELPSRIRGWEGGGSICLLTVFSKILDVAKGSWGQDEKC